MSGYVYYECQDCGQTQRLAVEVGRPEPKPYNHGDGDICGWCWICRIDDPKRHEIETAVKWPFAVPADRLQIIADRYERGPFVGRWDWNGPPVPMSRCRPERQVNAGRSPFPVPVGAPAAGRRAPRAAVRGEQLGLNL